MVEEGLEEEEEEALEDGGDESEEDGGMIARKMKRKTPVGSSMISALKGITKRETFSTPTTVKSLVAPPVVVSPVVVPPVVAPPVVAVAQVGLGDVGCECE